MREKVTLGKIWGIIYPMFLYTVISFAVSIILLAIMTFIIQATGDGVSSYEAALMASDGLDYNILLVTLCAQLATLPFLIFFMNRDINREKLNGRYKKYSHLSWSKYLLIVPLGFFSMLAANYFVSFLTLFMPEFMVESYADTETAIYGSSLPVQILAAVIAGPIVEELIFRGLIYNRIKKISNVVLAAILSALLFGIYHGNWIQAPYAFIVGLVAVYVYEKYKSIIAPIILHMSANLLSVLISMWASSTGDSEATTETSFMLTLIVYLIIIIIPTVFSLIMGIIINKTVKRKPID